MFERLPDMYTIRNLAVASKTRSQDCRLQKRYYLHLTKDFITAPEKFTDASNQFVSPFWISGHAYRAWYRS